ncbi:MAG TPA: glycosyltransferase [Candidatus Acidoferrum sp.]|nr:glycosyltransferase [Candidatus Acidoferrum sp.]
MKIGCVVDSASRQSGGLFESVRRLMQSLQAHNGQVTVFSVADKFSNEDLAAWAPVSVRAFRSLFKPWGYAPGLPYALASCDFAMLHVHGLWKYCSVASVHWARKYKRPHIVHPHGMLDPWALRNSRPKKLLAAALYENLHLRRASCIRALCQSEADSIRAYGLKNPICIIPNGVDLPANPNPQSPILNPQFTSGRKVLLYLGRLHPKKNLGALLDAWAALQRQSTAAQEWTLAITGWNEVGYEEQLRKQCSDLGLKCSDAQSSSIHNSLSSVSFTGPRFGDDKAAAYASCDAFILPSLSEGLPMVILEAWAYGKPVVMTPECNVPEGFAAGAAIQIGTTADRIVPGLRTLIESSDAERCVMGARGQQLVAERFTWDMIGKQMREVGDWVVGGGSAPACVRFD